MKTSDGPKMIKSGVKPPKPDGSKANRPLINENELTEWIAYWDDLESHWFFWNQVKDLCRHYISIGAARAASDLACSLIAGP